MEDAIERVKRLSLWNGDIAIEVLKGGASNASFAVCAAHGKFVVRLGDDYPFHQVSRQREAITSRAAFAAGLSPEIIHTEKGLMVVRYLEARTFTEADVQTHLTACVDLIQRCHKNMAAHISGQGAIFWVFQILRDYAQTLKNANHRHASHIARWMAITEQLEAAQVPLPIIFGHHDLLPGNFMHDGKRLWLIDWEYGAFGTAMFDLANLAAANQLSENAEDAMLHQYFGSTISLSTRRAFAAMKVAAALREAMWGMVSELYLNAPGVDYVAYAAEYVSRFERNFNDYSKRFP